MITVRDLRKDYKTGSVVIPALNGVSFDVEKNQFISIVGPSGCGKSTLLYVLGGMLEASGGSVTVDGFDVTRARDRELTAYRRDSVGFVFQKYNLISSLSVYDNLSLACKIFKKGSACAARIDAILEELGVMHKRNAKPLELSQGEQQRVAIARALVKEPKLVLADEPTGNLDSDNSLNIVRLFKEISRRTGQTILMITHNTQLAEMADRVVEMVDGRTVASAESGTRVGIMESLPGQVYTSEAKR